MTPTTTNEQTTTTTTITTIVLRSVLLKTFCTLHHISGVLWYLKSTRCCAARYTLYSLYDAYSKGAMSIDSDMPATQPAPEPAVATAAAAATDRAVANDYYSLKKPITSTVEWKLGKDDKDNGENDNDALYESIRGSSVSDSSPAVTPEPQRDGTYRNLCDAELGTSTSL